MGKTEIKVSCNDQVLKITEAPVLASGGLNEVRVVFSFCEKWVGFTKTAIFYRDEEDVYYAVLDENDTCVVPWEVCYEEGTFYFGVFGEKDNTRRTSNVVRHKVKRGAITSGMLPSEPTPAVYEQIVEMLGEIRETANHNIASIEKTGTEGLVDTYTITFIDGSTQTYTVTNGENGKDYVLTGEDKQEIVDMVLSTEELEKIRDDIADLKYVPIDITGISNNVGTKEKGRSVSSVTISWVVNKEPKSQNLDGVTLDVSARSKTIPGQFSTTQKFVVEVIDEKGKKDAESTTISFLNGVYYGALDANATIDSDAINSMSKRLQTGITGAFNMTATAGQKLTFAAPVSYGEPTKFTSGGLDYTWDKVMTNFNHKNQSEHTEPYNVWQNSEITVGTFSVTVVK